MKLYHAWYAITASLCCSSALIANPEGLQVIQGDVSVQTEGTSLQVHSSDRAILQWEEFSIDAGEVTRFLQPSSSSTVLNKVVGLNPSLINGVLEANGRVILVNPQGVIVGKEGGIRASEFIASTLDALDFDGDQIRCRGDVTFPLDNSALINLEGFVQATGVDLSGGRILLVAPQIQLSGEIRAEQGSLIALGQTVDLLPNAHIDVSGPQGGGSVFIGAEAHGENLFGLRGESTRMHPGVVIVADALLCGDGGKVVIWGDRESHFQGYISARGGPEGGDGGFIEISSPENLIFQGKIDTSALMGKTGLLLLDPSDITIGVGPSSPAFFNPYNPGTASATVAVTDIATALSTSNVTISTSNGVGGAGSITWTAGFPLNWGTGNSLSLVADGTLVLNSSITCTGSGGITFEAGITVPSSSVQINEGTFSTAGAISITSDSGGVGIGNGTAPVTINSTNSSIGMSATQSISLQGGVSPGSDVIVEAVGPIAMQAGNTINFGLSILSGSGVSVTTNSPSGTITLQSTGSGGGITLEGNGVPITVQASQAEVQIDIADGDLELSVHSSGSVNVIAGNGLSVTARSFHIDAHDQSTVSVDISGAPSTIQLTNDFVANAWPDGTPAISTYTLLFTNSPLSFTAGGLFEMDNQNPKISSFGFDRCTASFNIGGNVVVQGECVAGGGQTILGGTLCTGLAVAAGGDFSVLNAPPAGSPAWIQSGGPLSLYTQGDILIQGQPSPGANYLAFVQAGPTNPLSISAGGNITLSTPGAPSAAAANARVIQGHAAPALLIANRNIVLQAGCIDVDTPGITAPGLALTLVADNAFPTPPSVGTGAFDLDGHSYIYSITGTLAPQVFTAIRAQNGITGALNGYTFTPGPTAVNTPTEHWSTYYSQPFVGPEFTIFYKEPVPPPLPPPPAPTPVVPQSTAALQSVPGNVFDAIATFRYPMPAFSNVECFSLGKSALQGYWGKASRGALVFDNRSCDFIELDNYRKYAIERKTRF